MKVLIAVDGSKHTKHMLNYLTKHKNLLGETPEVTVLTVHPALPGFASRTVGKNVVADYHKEESDAVLDPVQKFLAKQGLPFTVRSRHSPRPRHHHHKMPE